jgi:FkbM family methyltransferase
MSSGVGSNWKLRIGGPLLLCVLAFGGFLLVNHIQPAGTARSFLRVADWWQSHWPMERGKALVFRLNSALYSIGVMKPVVVKTVAGITMEADSRDLVSQTILVKGLWEPKLTGIIMKSLPTGGVFIDVGAHIGYYSLLASRRVGAAGRVVAVEPNPETLQRLRRNLALNDSGNITVEEMACTDRETTLQFFPAGIENSGESSLSRQNAKAARAVTVRGRPLDEIVRSLALDRVDLIKIDVEGAEMQVLTGMREILARQRPKIVIELKPDLLANMGASLEAAKAVFASNNYTLAERDSVDDYVWIPAVVKR